MSAVKVKKRTYYPRRTLLLDQSASDSYWTMSEFWSRVIEFDQKNDLFGFIITGHCGTWQGSRDIRPVFCDSLKVALDRCFGRCDFFKVEQVDGTIEVKAYHHDGTNQFTIVGTNGKYGDHDLVLHDPMSYYSEGAPDCLDPEIRHAINREVQIIADSIRSIKFCQLLGITQSKLERIEGR